MTLSPRAKRRLLIALLAIIVLCLVFWILVGGWFGHGDAGGGVPVRTG